MRNLFPCAAILLGLSAVASELDFNFTDTPPGQTPADFHSTVAGQGKPGEWKIVMDEVPPLLAPLNTGAPKNTRQPVLAQTAREALDSHFPMLIYDGETFGNFKLTTRFKLAGGALEQMAGIVFRFQNESNFYVIRASGIGNNFRCYKVVNGALNPPLGPELEISKGVWHELTVQCDGNRILGALDGKETIRLVDNSSANRAGKVGFWTKSDSVSYFADTKITYEQRVVFAQRLVEREAEKYPRLLGLKIYSKRAAGKALTIVASSDAKEIGQPGGEVERDIVSHGTTYYSNDKDKKVVSVIAPLRDRNGDPIAAVRVEMKPFPGETQDAALIRARPIIKAMESQVPSLEDLLQR